jgi:hypothetical protein
MWTKTRALCKRRERETEETVQDGPLKDVRRSGWKKRTKNSGKLRVEL